MKIKDVECSLFRRVRHDVVEEIPMLTTYKKGGALVEEIPLIKVVTDVGIEGICMGIGGRWQVKVTDSILKPMLIGEDPLDRERLWQKMWKLRLYGKWSEGFIGCIDVALWDIGGKVANLPIYKLLGGYRDRIKAYASAECGDNNGGLDSPVAFADHAEQCKKEGFTAYKLHPFAPSAHTQIRGDPDRDISACKAVRERVGDEMALMFDAGAIYESFADVLRVGRELEKLNFLWYEMPLQDYDLASYARLKRELRIPILAAEWVEGNIYTSVERILRKSLDIVRSDAGAKGGITQLRKTAALCEAFGLKVEIHLCPNPLLNAANLHVACAIGNSDYYELGLLHPKLVGASSDFGVRNSIDRIDKEGYVVVPQKPEIGRAHV